MEWHGVIVRLSAKHATQIRKGFRSAFNANNITEEFFASYLGHTGVTTQDARNWTRIHVIPKKAALVASLTPIYADGWVMGKRAGAYMLVKKQQIKKADLPYPPEYEFGGSSNALLATDWSNWKPGNQAASALIKPEGGLQRLLDARNIVIDGVSNTKLDRIGTILGNALELGITPKQVSIMVDQVINDPQQALTIAQTEMSNAVVQAELEQYRDSGVEMVEWLVADPCEECQVNLDASPIGIDEEWPNGDAPVHPNCMCDIAPFISDTSNL